MVNSNGVDAKKKEAIVDEFIGDILGGSASSFEMKLAKYPVAQHQGHQG